MPDFTVVIDGPSPSLNATYGIGYQGKRCPVCGRGKPVLIKHKDVETWQTACSWLVSAARPRDWLPGRRVRLMIDWRTPRRKDSDAGLKALCDAVAVGLNMDDAVFLTTVRSNEIDKTRPRTIVEITNED